MSKKAYLILENGQVFAGKSVGKDGETIGKIVFSTSMTAYQEALTTPSLYGQILLQTFPMAGNYGVNDEDFESKDAKVNGYVVREVCKHPSNFRSTGDLPTFLEKQDVVGIEHIDTRCITRIIRDNGEMNAIITTHMPDDLEQTFKRLREYRITDAVRAVTTKDIYTVKDQDKNATTSTSTKTHTLAVLDLGVKRSTLTAFTNRGCILTVFPAFESAESLLSSNPQGVVIAGGPGDPADPANEPIIQEIKKLIDTKIPIFAIGLGHQLLAIACGANTQMLPHSHNHGHGHRGANQPVKDKVSLKTFITTQTHSYTVSPDSLPYIAEIIMTNANDNSIEAIKYNHIPAVGVQFYPDIKSTTLTTGFLYDRFLEILVGKQ